MKQSVRRRAGGCAAVLLAVFVRGAVWAASPTTGDPSPLVVVPSVVAGEGMAADHARIYADRLVVELARRGVRVLNPSTLDDAELAAERQRQDCESDAARCPALFVGVQGAEALLRVTVSSRGLRYRYEVELRSLVDGSPLASAKGTAANLVALSDLAPRNAEALAHDAGKRLGRVLPVMPPLRSWALVPMAGTVVGSAVGGVLLSSAHQRYLSINDANWSNRPVNAHDAFMRREVGQREQLAGGILLGVAAASFTAAVVMFALGGDPPSEGVGPIIDASEPGLGLSWRWP
jgi:hypothetical protein